MQTQDSPTSAEETKKSFIAEVDRLRMALSLESVARLQAEIYNARLLFERTQQALASAQLKQQAQGLELRKKYLLVDEDSINWETGEIVRSTATSKATA